MTAVAVANRALPAEHPVLDRRRPALKPSPRWSGIPTRAVVPFLAVMLLLGCGLRTSQPAKVPRIGYLEGGDQASTVQLLDGFRQGLRELGLNEDQNLSIMYSYADAQEDRLPGLAADLVATPVDLIVTTTTQGTRAAARATSSTPVVFAGLADPVAAGIVESLARPGANVTGTTTFSTQLHGKRLELLKETVPGLTRVAILANPSSAATSLEQLRAVAPSLNLELLFFEMRTTDEFAPAFDDAVARGAGAVMTLPDALFFNNRRRLIQLAAERNLPDAHFLREFTDEGGFMSYGANRRDAFRRAAAYVDKILKGATPSDLPVEQSSEFELSINLNTARTLGLTIPPQVLLEAQEVIQ